MGEETTRAEKLRGHRLAEARRSLELSSRAADLARAAGETSAEIAATQEADAQWSGGPESAAGFRAAEAQRRNEACQRAAARLHDNYVRQLEQWVAKDDPHRALRPVFMSAVAEVAGWQGAVLTLLTGDGNEGLVAASSHSVRAAHELEVALAEGPSREAVRHQTITVAHGSELEHRWPRYGPAVHALGVQCVASAPIHLGGTCGGCMTFIDMGHTTSAQGVRRLSEVTEALTAVLRTSDGTPVDDEDPLGLQHFEREDFQPSLNAAAGVLHELDGYAMADAIALIRAHAFAEDRTVAAVADGVIRRGGLS